MIRLVSLLVTVLSLVTMQTPAFAIPAVYDASVFLSISGSSQTAVSFTLSPGLAFTPPPILLSGSATATSSASANIPGQIQAAVSGSAFAGESDAFGTSLATAIGFGTIAVGRGGVPDFPLHIHETWSVLAFGGVEARALIRFLVLLDGLTIHSGSAFANGTQDPLTDDVTTTLSLGLPRGVHSLVFIAEAEGLAMTPEPTSLLLLGSSLAGLGAAAWRRVRVHRVRTGESS